MPKKIDAMTDMDILRDIGLGMKNKDIAVTYGVSASYVSKLKQGKKVIEVPMQTLASSSDLDVMRYIETEINIREQELKMFKYVLKIMKEANYAR